MARNNTLIVCAVSEAYLPFLNNWLITIARQNHQDKVLVIAEDYATLDKINERWPGHAVLIPPALEAAAAHKFGSQVVSVDIWVFKIPNIGRSDFFFLLDFLQSNCTINYLCVGELSLSNDVSFGF